MTYYLIAPNGRYVQRLEGSTAEILTQVPEGHDVTMFAPPRNTDYWDGTSWVHIGPQPHWFMEFNYDTKTWVDTRNIEEVRQLKWQEIKSDRNTFEFNGFTFEGKRFDSNQVSQGRILAAVLFAEPVDWTLEDDTVVSLTVEDLQGLGMALKNHVNSAHNRGRIARQAINEATTISEIEAVFF